MFELDYPHTEEMRIHSLNGEMREATLLAKVGDNDYIAEYKDVYKRQESSDLSPCTV